MEVAARMATVVWGWHKGGAAAAAALLMALSTEQRFCNLGMQPALSRD